MLMQAGKQTILLFFYWALDWWGWAVVQNQVMDIMQPLFAIHFALAAFPHFLFPDLLSAIDLLYQGVALAWCCGCGWCGAGLQNIGTTAWLSTTAQPYQPRLVKRTKWLVCFTTRATPPTTTKETTQPNTQKIAGRLCRSPTPAFFQAWIVIVLTDSVGAVRSTPMHNRVSGWSVFRMVSAS